MNEILYGELVQSVAQIALASIWGYAYYKVLGWYIEFYT